MVILTSLKFVTILMLTDWCVLLVAVGSVLHVTSNNTAMYLLLTAAFCSNKRNYRNTIYS